MRALPVPKDTIDLLVTTAFISSTDAAHPTSTSIVTPGCDTRLLLEGADRMGQQLWEENYASVSHVVGRTIPAPKYEWQPVAELLGDGVTTEQVLQIERCRLYVAETTCHHPGSEDSPAQIFLQRLGRSIAARLAKHPQVPSLEHAGVFEYEGLSRAIEDWDRSVGFRWALSATGAQKQSEGQL